MSWRVVFTKAAQKDARKLAAAGLKEKTQGLLAMLADNPFQNPPPYEKGVGDLSGAYSRRINIQYGLVYQVLKEARVVKVLRMWTHYESRVDSAVESVPAPINATTLESAGIW